MYYCWLESLSWSEFFHFCTPCSNKAFSETLCDAVSKAKCSVSAICAIRLLIPCKVYQAFRTVLGRGKWQSVGKFKIWCSHSDIDGDAILLEIGARLVVKYLPTFGRRLFRSATSALRLHKPWWCRQKLCRNFGDILSIDIVPYRRKLESSEWLDYTGLF